MSNKPYKTIPDPLDDTRWLVKVGDTVIRILDIVVEVNPADESELFFNHKSELVEGPPLSEDDVNNLVAQVMQEAFEYKDGRAQYLKQKQEK